jgi:hypothetical protein
MDARLLHNSAQPPHRLNSGVVLFAKKQSYFRQRLR